MARRPRLIAIDGPICGDQKGWKLQNVQQPSASLLERWVIQYRVAQHAIQSVFSQTYEIIGDPPQLFSSSNLFVDLREVFMAAITVKELGTINNLALITYDEDYPWTTTAVLAKLENVTLTSRRLTPESAMRLYDRLFQDFESLVNTNANLWIPAPLLTQRIASSQPPRSNTPSITQGWDPAIGSSWGVRLDG